MLLTNLFKKHVNHFIFRFTQKLYYFLWIVPIQSQSIEMINTPLKFPINCPKSHSHCEFEFIATYMGCAHIFVKSLFYKMNGKVCVIDKSRERDINLRMWRFQLRLGETHRLVGIWLEVTEKFSISPVRRNMLNKDRVTDIEIIITRG